MFDAATPLLGAFRIPVASVPAAPATIAEEARYAHRYVLLAEPSPGLLPRLLQPLAKRDLTPDVFRARRLGDMIRVEVAVAVDADAARRVEGDLRRVVGVTRLEVERGRVIA